MTMFKSLLVAAVAIPAVASPGFVQAAKPAAAAAAEEAKPASKSLAGELVAFDQTAKTVTLKHTVDKKPMQLTFAVEDATVATIAQLKPGDHVKVTYVEMGEKRIIKSIVKA